MTTQDAQLLAEVREGLRARARVDPAWVLAVLPRVRALRWRATEVGRLRGAEVDELARVLAVCRASQDGPGGPRRSREG